MVKSGKPARRAGGSGSASSSNGGGSYKAKRPVTVQRARDKTRRQGPRLFEDPANDERLLAAQLKRLGLYAANTLGDGSCLFRALSDQLHGTPNYHLAIRSEVCNFLLTHSSQFIAFIDDSSHSSPEAAFATHVAEMRHSATYGTQVEIVAFARMVKRRVKVIQAELIYVIGYEDESPSEREKRAIKRNDAAAKGKAKEDVEELPDLYIVYHNWEHYSSARNIGGPHSGLPCIKETKPGPGADPTAQPSDEPLATREESLILSSLRFPHRHSVLEIRKLIHDNEGSWEQALELLLDNEIDETESEDFNLSSPPPLTTSIENVGPKTPQPQVPPSIGISSPHNHALRSHQHRHTLSNPASLSTGTRSSSPSASSSTATSTATYTSSTSTTATHLSDLGDLSIHIDRQKSSASPSLGSFAYHPTPASTTASSNSTISNIGTPASSSSRVRSRAASPDPEIQAAESPRQKFRITRDHTHTHANGHIINNAYLHHRRNSLDDREDSSSFGGDFNDDNFANLDSSSVLSASSGSGSGVEETDNSATVSRQSRRLATNSLGVQSPESPSASPAELDVPPTPKAGATVPLPRAGGKKKKDALLAVDRPPTRRQRKQMVKSGIASPIGKRTRSKALPAREETGLQREFRELFV